MIKAAPLNGKEPKFSEADVQIALYKAIQSASRTDSSPVHEILGRLIVDRVQKPKRIIAELAINEAIEITAKLDVNLIKILAFSFIFSRTKLLGLLHETALIQHLASVANEFNNLDITYSKFEYLEAISCGKFLQFISNNLIQLIVTNYPHLFMKKISLQQLTELELPISIQAACFIKNDENVFQLSPYIGLYLFEDTPVSVNGIPFAIADNIVRERLKNFLNNNRLSNDEIAKTLMVIPAFENLLNIWDKNGFSQFSLTAVGIAIGRAYLEQKKLGDYDINIWIN